MKPLLQQRRIKTEKEIAKAIRDASKVKPYRAQTALTTLPNGEQIVTTCQICGAAVRANEGVIAPHGFERAVVDGRKYGPRISEGCIGGGEPPFEYDRGALSDHIADVDQQVMDLKAELNATKKGTPVEVSYKSPDRYGVMIWRRVVVRLGAELPQGSESPALHWHDNVYRLQKFDSKSVRVAMDKGINALEDYVSGQIDRYNEPQTMSDEVWSSLIDRSDMVRTAASAKGHRNRKRTK